MKHWFIINPAAGQGAATGWIREIEAVCTAAGTEYSIYETKSPGDAERFVRGICEDWSARAPQDTRPPGPIPEDPQDTRPSAQTPGTPQDPDPATHPAEARQPLRFYACGGDGTLNEVVNGAAGYDFAEIGCIPSGTGNDFIRNFPEGMFDDPAAQIRGEAHPCDLIHYEGVCDGEQVSRYCVNMFNIGFDSNVVDMTDRMKRLPLVSGTMAYLTSIAVMLVERKGADLRVEFASDGFVHDGRLLLIAVANGCFCGGGIKGLPLAATDDGMFDVSLIRNVPRRTFARLFPKYMKGTHLTERRLADVIRYTQETSLTISPNRGTMKLCVDGQIAKAGPVTFTIHPKAFRFVIPTRRIRT